MNRKLTRLSLLLCIVFWVECGVQMAHSQEQPANAQKTLANPGGGQVVYGPVSGEITLNGGMASMLRQVSAHFGNRPLVESLVRERNRDWLAAFFSVKAANDGNTPMAGLVIVAGASNAVPQGAILYDIAERFASTEPALLRLLATAGSTGSSMSPDSAAKAESVSQPGEGVTATLHLASGGDKSASICLPTDWAITHVADGSLTAKGPHSEWLALGVAVMILDPDAPGAGALAKASAYRSAPRQKYPAEGELFTAFTNVVNQLRQKSKLEPATFTLVSSRQFDAQMGQLRPMEAKFNVDLADGARLRMGSARIDTFRNGHAPEWLMSISTSSIPLPYVAAEQGTVLAMIRSFQVKQPASLDEDDHQTYHGDPAHWDDDRNSWVMGRRTDSQNCEAIDGQGGEIGWPGKIALSYILDPAAAPSGTDRLEMNGGKRFTDWLVKSNPGYFSVREDDRSTQGLDY